MLLRVKWPLYVRGLCMNDTSVHVLPINTQGGRTALDIALMTGHEGVLSALLQRNRQ